MRSKHKLIVLSVVAALAVVAVVVYAGNPDTPPGPPEMTSSYRLEDIYDRLSTGAAGTQITFTEPISGPTVGTGHTLDEIMAVAPSVDDTNGATAAQVVSGTTYWGLRSGAWGLQTGLAAVGGNVTGDDGQLTFAIPDGFYTGSKTATAQDADLIAGNIAQGVDLFGVTGSAAVATGDATPADVLTGTTFSSGSGSGLSGAMPDNGAVTLTPTTTQQTIAAGYHNGSGYVEGDADLATGNIRSGTNLFGVAGDPNVVDTSSGDAAAADILSDQVAWVDGGEVTGTMANNGAVTLTPTTTQQTIAAGYHNGSGYVEGDADLATGNIKADVNLFGITGTLSSGSTYNAGVPKTGQTISYTVGDDGDLEMGVEWPIPRFITGTTGVVTDTLTGLIWLENANCPATTRNWATAFPDVASLNTAGTMNSNDCGDTSNGGSHQTDWRLPNVRELQSLIDYGEYNLALPDSHPFTGVQSDYYWSSTTDADDMSNAWGVSLRGGRVARDGKTGTYYVWPVRGAQ